MSWTFIFRVTPPAPLCGARSASRRSPGACSLPPSTRRVSHARAVTRSLRPLRYRHKRAFGRALSRSIPPQRRASTSACRLHGSPIARHAPPTGFLLRVTAAPRAGIGHCSGFPPHPAMCPCGHIAIMSPRPISCRLEAAGGAARATYPAPSPSPFRQHAPECFADETGRGATATACQPTSRIGLRGHVPPPPLRKNATLGREHRTSRFFAS